MRMASLMRIRKNKYQRATTTCSIQFEQDSAISIVRSTNGNTPMESLDKMIDFEENTHDGFSVFYKGQKLKKSLINPDRVKNFLKGDNPRNKLTGHPR